MAYLLYGDRGSGSFAVEAALCALGASFELHDVDLRAEQQRGAAYQAVNPQRKLPALITPAGETLTESAAILIALDERHPAAGLLPPVGSRERAQALRWLLFVASELYPLIEIVDYPERFASSADAAPGVRDAARQRWSERWLLLENAISGKPWLSPHGFSFADVYIAMASRWGMTAEWRCAHLPRVEALAAAVAVRPELVAAWRRHFGPR
jgi:GST-like protein